MIYKVSTTGSQNPVVLDDLGARSLSHPTVELDLGLEYTDDELIDSKDLRSAIENNWLTLDDTEDVPATEEYVDTTISGAILEKGSLATVQVENEGTVAVDTTWTDFTFSTTIYQNRIDVVEHNPSDFSEILIKADGTYSITYGLVVEAQSTTTTTYSQAMKNGSLIPGSDSEIRTYQSERHELGGNATFDASSGDIIKVQHRRSSDGTVDIVHASCNVIKLDGVKGDPGDQGLPGEDGQDGVLTVSGTADYFNGYDSAGTTQLNTTYTDIPLIQGYTTSAFSHSGAEVTILQDNTYVIIGRFTVSQPSTASRSEAQMRIVSDTGGGYVEIPGTIGTCYSRTTAQGKSTASAQVVLDLSSGDKLKLQAKENSGGTLFGEQNGSGLMIFTTAGQTGPQGVQGEPGADGRDGINGVDGQDGQDGIDAGATLAVVQVRRTSAATLTNTFTDVSFDVTDEENDPTLIEHNNTNTEQINIYDGGAYLISYDFGIDSPSSAAQVTYAEARLTISGTSVINGSFSDTTSFNESSLDGNPLFYNHLSNSCVVSLGSNSFITLQMRYLEDAADTKPNGTLKVIKLVGARGEQGPQGIPGLGANVYVRDQNGSYLSNTPNGTLRFSGGGMTVVAEGDDTARINVDGSIQLQNQGSDINSGPWTPANFSKVNFEGTGVSTALTTMDIATVTINSPIFGTWYGWDGDESTTTTNSTSPVVKSTANLTNIDAGYYRIGWYYEWKRNTASNDYRATLVIDSTDTVMEHSQEPKDINSWHTASGFIIHQFTSGSHDIVFSHYGETTGNTSSTRRLRIEFWRVA